MSNIEEKQLNRFNFLKKVYEITDGDYLISFQSREIGKQLGFDQKTTDNIVDFLVREGLLSIHTLGYHFVITHQGVLEIEQALANPKDSTRYFPPVINILSGDFRGAIVNIDSELINVQQIIRKTDAIGEVEKSDLLKQIEELKILLQTAPQEIEKEVQTIVWAAEAHIETVLNEKDNSSKKVITKEGLEKAAQNIASVLPQVIVIIKRIIELLQHLN